MSTSRQTLIHHTAGCHTCGASVDARNALAWAHNHVRRNPGHFVDLSLGYAVRSNDATSTSGTTPNGERHG